MDIRTTKEKSREARDCKIRRDYLAEANTSHAPVCRIATAMANSGLYGYKSVNSILRSLRRTNTIQ